MMSCYDTRIRLFRLFKKETDTDRSQLTRKQDWSTGRGSLSLDELPPDIHADTSIINYEESWSSGRHSAVGSEGPEILYVMLSPWDRL